MPLIVYSQQDNRDWPFCVNYPLHLKRPGPLDQFTSVPFIKMKMHWYNAWYFNWEFDVLCILKNVNGTATVKPKYEQNISCISNNSIVRLFCLKFQLQAVHLLFMHERPSLLKTMNNNEKNWNFHIFARILTEERQRRLKSNFLQ